MNSEAIVQALSDKQDIRELVARYSFAIDDHDFDGLADCFAGESRYRSVDGVISVNGRDAIVEYFRKRMQALGPSNHITHQHLITLDAMDRDRATGKLSSHAEVIVDQQPTVTCLRYNDSYVREDGRWRFADRTMSFFYYCAVKDYPTILISSFRKQLGGKPAQADYPEQLPGWTGVPTNGK